MTRASCVVFLQTSAHYSLRCYDVDLVVLEGECNINGYTLTPSSDPLTLNSLESHSRMSLNAGSVCRVDVETVERLIKTHGLYNVGVEKGKVGGAVLVKKSGKSTKFLRSTYKKLFDDSDDERALLDVDYFKLYRGLEGAVSVGRDWLGAVPPPDPTSPARIAICGPQNSGKSTLCRYTVNTLLAHSKAVLLLETDIGQCEISPPGHLTLTLIRHPLTNPPFCNTANFAAQIAVSRDPHLTSQSYCMGVVSPSSIMLEYLDKIGRLSDSLKLYPGVPCVVNLMGWTKGFGVALHSDILRIIKPTHVINLVTNSPKDLPPISELLISPGVLPEPPHHPKLSPVIKDVPGFVSPGSPHGTFAAFELRHMSLLNYFSPVYKHDKISPPYKIKFNDISVVLSDNVENSLTAYALNCSVVGLLTASSASSCRPPGGANQDIRVIEEAGDMVCLGLGIIRAVDVTEGVFYLNTPVDKEMLDRVFVFKHTSLPVPHMASGTLPQPYLSNLAASEILGAGSRSQRANLKRRYHQVNA